MKRIITTLFLLILFGTTTAQTTYKYDWQDGYKFIEQAEKSFKKGDVEKTEKLLAKAKNSDYGFCGNAWMSAYEDINRLEVQVLTKKQKYDEALSILDSMFSMGNAAFLRDSLKVYILIQKFGEEKVKQAFREAKIVLDNDNRPFFGEYLAILPDLNYRFWFQGPRIGDLYVDGVKMDPAKSGNDFYDLAKDLRFYKLLQ